MIHEIIHRINSVDLDDDLTMTRIILVIVGIATFVAFLLSFCTEDDIVRYYQKDYKHVKFYDSTIAEAGCGLCAAATVLSNNGCYTDPEEMLEIYTSLYPNQKEAGVYSSFFIKLGFDKKNLSDIQDYLDNDYWVIVNIGGEHWITIYGDWEIVDPMKNIKRLTPSKLDKLKPSKNIYIFKQKGEN